MELGAGSDFLLRKSTTSSLVLVVMQMVSCTPLYEGVHNTPVLLLLPLTSQSTIAESSANFCRWQVSEERKVWGVQGEQKGGKNRTLPPFTLWSIGDRPSVSFKSCNRRGCRHIHILLHVPAVTPACLLTPGRSVLCCVSQLCTIRSGL